MKIKAALAQVGTKDFAIQEIDMDDPRPDEIMIKIVGVGICHTDLVIRDAGNAVFPFPAVLGHEGSGIVAAIGDDISKVKPGDKVAITFRSCGNCDRCKAGDAAYCRHFPQLNIGGGRADGSKPLNNQDGPISSNFFGQSSFATYALAYERNVIKITDGVPVGTAGPLGCGIQTGAGAIINSLETPAGSSLLITGGGPVGLSAVMGAKIQGCSTIILVEPQISRRDLAIELGATHVIDPTTNNDTVKAVREIVPEGVDFAFDSTGLTPVLADAMNCLGTKGVLGVVGLSDIGTPVPGDINQLISSGHTIRGIVEGDSDPDVFIPQLMEHHLAGRLPYDKIITTYPFDQINQAIADQHDGRCVKAVLLMEE